MFPSDLTAEQHWRQSSGSDLQLRISEGHCPRAMPGLLALSAAAPDVIALLGWRAWFPAALSHAAAAWQGEGGPFSLALEDALRRPMFSNAVACRRAI